MPLDEVRALAQEVVDAHAGEVKTHSESCYQWHAECLAQWILELTREDAAVSPV